jgi:hypothetical protein
MKVLLNLKSTTGMQYPKSAAKHSDTKTLRHVMAKEDLDSLEDEPTSPDSFVA